MNRNTLAARRGASALAIATSIAILMGATAHAEPSEQGGTTPSAPSEQGGTSPSAPSEQGGTTPPPAPAPAPAPEPVQPPTYNPGPWGAPAAPSAPESEHVAPTAPTYDDSYNPIPNGGFRPTPNRPPVKRIAPKPRTFRAGNITIAEKDIPNFPNKHKTIDWANGWTSYGEQEIANHLIAIGVPPDEASRQAASAIVGAVTGGAIGGAISFTATTIVVGTFSVPIGAAIGAGVGSTMANPISILGGAGVGAAAGGGVALGAGAAAGTAGAILGAAIGGAAGWVLGAGDPGQTAKKPKNALPEQAEPGGKHRKPELANPDANQFELTVDADTARQVGLPAVDYTVTQRGDVELSVGSVEVGWTAEQAQAPIRALGPAAPVVEKVINDSVRTVTDEVSKAVDGLTVNWPQLDPAPTKTVTAGPRHAR